MPYISDSWRPIDAFPRLWSADVHKVVENLPENPRVYERAFEVVVRDERLAIPYQIAVPEPTEAAVATLSTRQRLILACFYTRHHDGYIRQEYLERIVGSLEPWVIPYVMKLVGEYVLAIIDSIRLELSELDVEGSRQWRAYGEFLAANPEFFTLAQRQVTSYWECYHRRPRDDFRQYPGGILIETLQDVAESYTGSAIERQTPRRPSWR